MFRLGATRRTLKTEGESELCVPDVGARHAVPLQLRYLPRSFFASAKLAFVIQIYFRVVL